MDITPLAQFRATEAGSVVALGFFDGVHRGHRSICEQAVALARQRDAQAVVFTMRDHPMTVLRPAQAPLLLTQFDEKCRWLAAAGADAVAWIDFDEAFSQQSPRQFVVDVLGRQLDMRVAVSGASYRFGHGAAGTPDTLRGLGDELGFSTQTVAAVQVDGETVSSSRIREQLAAGGIDEATTRLGHSFAITSVVERGEGRGRQLGFATANLRLEPRQLMPPNGVYAVHAWLGTAATAFDGVANLGVRPTFGEQRRTFEVHLLAPIADIYGQSLRVEFVTRLRDERKFENVEALVRQIRQDIESARRVLA